VYGNQNIEVSALSVEASAKFSISGWYMYQRLLSIKHVTAVIARPADGI